MERIRILFINHSTSMVGGSSQSLRNLILNLDEKVDMIVPKDILVRNKEIKDFYGSNINKLYRCYLPFRKSISIFEENIDWSDWCHTEEDFRNNKNEIFNIIKKNKYDVIHLNSYVLYPLLSSRYPMIIHVREICNANALTKKFIQMQFRRSHGIIYIDQATKEALGVEERSIVLNNPFDQRKTLEVNLQDVRSRYSIQENETVFTYVEATNNPPKGLFFVMDAFIKANCKDAKLLIVGPEKVTRYEKYSNLIFTGKISQMEEIYAISDYVLRGDNVVNIGRTIYEGLYSGCNVIIPGNEKVDMKKMFENDKFREQIFFYGLRDTESLVKMIIKRNGKKKDMLLGLSNVDEYVKQFKKFVFGMRKYGMKKSRLQERKN